jgi:hypothetical protein
MNNKVWEQTLQTARGYPTPNDQGLQQPMIDPIMVISSLLGPQVLEQLMGAMKMAPRMAASEAGALFPIGNAEEKYATSLPVKAYTEPGVPFYDEVKGLNPGHAYWRAKRNWPGVEVQKTGFSGQTADKAQKIMDAIAMLRQQVNSLTSK